MFVDLNAILRLAGCWFDDFVVFSLVCVFCFEFGASDYVVWFGLWFVLVFGFVAWFGCLLCLWWLDLYFDALVVVCYLWCCYNPVVICVVWVALFVVLVWVWVWFWLFWCLRW